MTSSNHRTSKLLQDIVDKSNGGTVQVGDFMKLLGERTFALAILIFSLPSVVAGAIPGFSTITGVPMMFIAFQMVLGRDAIWLPKVVAEKKFSEEMLTRILRKCIPFVIWLEKFLCPRWNWVTTWWGERLMGLVIVLLAALLSLPIPGGNLLPGIGISILALAMLERDGVLAAAGMAFILGTAVFMVKLIVGAVHMVTGWFSSLF